MPAVADELCRDTLGERAVGSPVDDDGQITAKSIDGVLIIKQLLLDQDLALATRRSKMSLLLLKQQFPEDPIVDKLFLEAFSFPDDLPDLKTLRPQEGKLTREDDPPCYFDLKQWNQLPPIY